MTELQGKLLDLIKIFDACCRQFDIPYYLTGGSLIGAVRHRGFIPWDDDMDIIMSRDSFEKFYHTARGSLPDGIEVRSQYEDPELSVTINHFTDVRTTEIYRFHLVKPEITGILIDVLIMDPVPDTDEARKEYRRALTEHTELTNLYYQYAMRNGPETNYQKNLSRVKQVGLMKVLEDITAKAFHYTEEESQLYAQRFASAPHFWPKEYYGTPQYVPFEDTYLPIPEYYGDCLSIGYDEDWFRIPRGGPTKTTHEYCIRHYDIPCAIILNDFEEHVDREQMLGVYQQRKNLWMEVASDKFRSELELDEYAIAAVKLQYRKKLAQTDVLALVTQKDYEELEAFFEDYLFVQCHPMVTGSSSIAGWKNWYRKCHPKLIDIGDDALYAVLKLLVHQQKLGWMGRILRARGKIDRPWPEALAFMRDLYQSVREVVSLYQRHEFQTCREVLSPLLAKMPDVSWFFVYDLKLKHIEGYLYCDLEAKIDEGIAYFGRDDELLFLKAEAELEKSNPEAAVDIYWELVAETNNGLVMLAMKDRVQEMMESEYSGELSELLLEIRRQSGEVFEIEEEKPGEEDEIDEELKNGSDSFQDNPDEKYQLEYRESEIKEKSGVQEATGSDEYSETLVDQEEGSDLSWNEMDVLGKGLSEEEKESIESRNEPEESITKDDSEESLEEEKTGLSLYDGPIEREVELTIVQRIRLELLKELKAICKENKIPYFLCEKSLMEALRFGRYLDANADIQVLMKADDCEKFVQAVNRKNDPKRKIVSMDTNPEFHRFCVRYCNMETLDFSATQMFEPFGIFISIEILRRESTSKWVNKYYRSLELGWESMHVTRKTIKSAQRSEKLVRFLCKIMGQERVAKRLYRKFMSEPRKPKKDKLFQRYYFGRRIIYPAYWFEHRMEVEYEGIRVSTTHFYNSYMKKRFGVRWKTRQLPESKWNPMRRVISVDIAPDEYRSFLTDECKIDRKKVWGLWRQTNRTYAQIKDFSKQADQYWSLMEACACRHAFALELMHKKDELRKMYRSGQDRELFEELREYNGEVLKLIKRNIALYIDEDFGKLAEYYLLIKGHPKLAKKYKQAIKEQNWEPVDIGKIPEKEEV